MLSLRINYIEKRQNYQGFFVTMTLPRTHLNFGFEDDLPLSFKI